jgi:hypothetical protein
MPECGERGQSNCQFLASFSGRPQQPGLFFNQENTGNVFDPFGLSSSFGVWQWRGMMRLKWEAQFHRIPMISG